MSSDKEFESLFASFGMATCIATVIVAFGKIVTKNYFFYMLIFLVLVTLVVICYGHLLEMESSVMISNEMKELVSDAEGPQKVKKQFNDRLSIRLTL